MGKVNVVILLGDDNTYMGLAPEQLKLAPSQDGKGTVLGFNRVVPPAKEGDKPTVEFVSILTYPVKTEFPAPPKPQVVKKGSSKKAKAVVATAVIQ